MWLFTSHGPSFKQPDELYNHSKTAYFIIASTTAVLVWSNYRVLLTAGAHILLWLKFMILAGIRVFEVSNVMIF
jgi:hypothetical protein